MDGVGAMGRRTGSVIKMLGVGWGTQDKNKE